MKILFFIENYYKAGIDTFIMNLINNLDDNKEIVLVSNNTNPSIYLYKLKIRKKIAIIEHNIVLYANFRNKLAIFIKNDFIIKCICGFFRYFILIFNIFRLKSLFAKINADKMMVINGGYPGGDSCRAASIAWGMFSKLKPKSIHNFHNFVITPNKKNAYLESFFDKLVDKYTSVFITVSRVCLKSIKNRQSLAKKAQKVFIYNGLEDITSPNENCFDIKKELNLGLDSKICLMLGVYEPRKGHKFLLKAFSKVIKEIKDAHLVICGHGETEEIEKVKTCIKNLELEGNVHIQNYREDVVMLLEQTDVLVIPSQAFESFGLTAIEAMRQKVPVVATNFGGLPEVIKDNEGGYCIDKSDIDTFAQKIIELLNDENLRIVQGDKGYNRYKKYFTAKRMADEYNKYLED